ncbi:MAG TPA: hypothetical protein VIH00_03565 [Candidatus Limnocylindrales bacterium]
MPDGRRIVARHELPGLDDAALRAARAFDLMVVAARDVGNQRWLRFLEPLPDRLRDDDPVALRRTARRCRSAFGPNDSVLDALPTEVGVPAMRAIDDLIRVLARLEAAGGRLDPAQ